MTNPRLTHTAARVLRALVVTGATGHVPTARQVAGQIDLPRETVERVLLRLRRHGLTERVPMRGIPRWSATDTGAAAVHESPDSCRITPAGGCALLEHVRCDAVLA